AEMRRDGTERRQLPGFSDTLFRSPFALNVSGDGSGVVIELSPARVDGQGPTRLVTYSMPDGPAFEIPAGRSNYSSPIWLGDAGKLVVAATSPTATLPASVFVIPVMGGGSPELIAAATH